MAFLKMSGSYLPDIFFVIDIFTYFPLSVSLIIEIFFVKFLNDFSLQPSYGCKTNEGVIKMELFADLNWALLAPIIIIQVILLIVALVDLIKIEKTNGPKWVWAIVILVVNIIGPILYFVIGRRNH